MGRFASHQRPDLSTDIASAGSTATTKNLQAAHEQGKITGTQPNRPKASTGTQGDALMPSAQGSLGSRRKNLPKIRCLSRMKGEGILKKKIIDHSGLCL